MKNSLSILIIAINFLVSAAFITYDNGNACKWYYTIWTGIKGNSYSQTINFSSAFNNIPQVAINPQITEVVVSTTAAYGYKVSISEVTTTYFKIYLQADYSKMYNMCFNWFALDDKRFEIINQFNIDNPATTPLTHNNKNALSGFIFYTSFVAQTSASFTLKVNSITETTFNVEITNTNIKNLGYTVVLGPAGAFSSSSLITNLPAETGKYCSSTITLVSNKLWYFYAVQFSFTPTQDFKAQFEETKTSTTDYYCLSTWFGGIGAFLGYGHQTTTINYGFPSFLPMTLSKVRTSKMESLLLENTIEISIPEISKSYTTIGDFSFEAPSSITKFSISIKISCKNNQKITAYFLKQYQQSLNIAKNCFAWQNQVSIHTIFAQSYPQYQYFILSIASSQVVLTQKLINQDIETKILVQINIQQQ